MNTTNDPIADMLTRIRNAIASRHESVPMPHSKIKEAIAEILKANGFIEGFKIDTSGQFKQLIIHLASRAEAITKIERVSKPGRRIYTGREDIPLVLGGRGMVIVSTSAGV